MKLLSDKSVKIGEKTFKSIINQLLSVVLYLNAQKIYHKNIHPENIQIHSKSPDIIIKLSNICLTSLLQNPKTGAKKIGSAQYSAPELLIKNEDHSKCDLWSLGIITYHLLTSTNIFEGPDHEALVKSQFLNIKKKLLVKKGLLNKESIDFIQRLLERDVNKRMTGEEAHEHQWLKSDSSVDVNSEEAVEFLKGLTNYANGNLLKRTVVNYMVSKNFYETQNLQILKLFQELDEDHTGSIDTEELFKYYGKYFPGTESEVMNRIEKMIKKVNYGGDTSRDDERTTINYEEFLVICSRVNGEFCKEKLIDVFNSLDITNSGYIEKEDLKSFLRHPKISETYLNQLIEKYDEDNDKKISFDEFYNMVNE